jgi:hypothetical protein
MGSEAQAREMLASAAYSDGCHEQTRDAILTAPDGMLPMYRVKVSVAVEAIEKALAALAARQPSAGWEEVGPELVEALVRMIGAYTGDWINCEDAIKQASAALAKASALSRQPEESAP